jgi:hypothetical protein
MSADPLAPLLTAVLDPAAARPSGRLRPLVVGGHPLRRLPPASLGWPETLAQQPVGTCREGSAISGKVPGISGYAYASAPEAAHPPHRVNSP